MDAQEILDSCDDPFDKKEFVQGLRDAEFRENKKAEIRSKYGGGKDGKESK